MKKNNNIFRYLTGLAVVIGLRLLPHPPNVEPIMATMMPFSKKWGWVSGFIFGLLAILSFDLITGTGGVWSLVTAPTYALLGVASGLYLKNKENKTRYYVYFAIAGTLIYDAITGIAMGTLIFGQNFMVVFLGQIPFTAYHLAGNIVLSIVISPLLYKWVITNPEFEFRSVLSRLKLAAE